MHLLVLSAFRPGGDDLPVQTKSLVSMHLLVLSAFRREGQDSYDSEGVVSMHLLVLSAFRHEAYSETDIISESQCTFWCSVLSDTRLALWTDTCS